MVTVKKNGEKTMNNWRDKLYRFMQGRYGRIDELGRFLMYLLFGLLLVSFFVRSSIFSLLILLVLIYDTIVSFQRYLCEIPGKSALYPGTGKSKNKMEQTDRKSHRQHPSNL